jgi:hypothetical protein
VARRRTPVDVDPRAPMAYAGQPQYAPRGTIYQQQQVPGYPAYPQPQFGGFQPFWRN